MIIVTHVAHFLWRSNDGRVAPGPSLQPHWATPSWPTTQMWFSWCKQVEKACHQIGALCNLCLTWTWLCQSQYLDSNSIGIQPEGEQPWQCSVVKQTAEVMCSPEVAQSMQLSLRPGQDLCSHSTCHLTLGPIACCKACIAYRMCSTGDYHSPYLGCSVVEVC